MSSRGLATRRQRGITLVVALIMLLLLTLLVSGAFSLSTVNLKAVGNMQARSEALAAVNTALEDVISSSFVGAGVQTPSVDINNDGTNDYSVTIQAPTCIRATIADAVAPSSVSLGVISSDTWNTVWLLDAIATDLSGGSGATVHVRTGVRVLLTDAEKKIECP
jgi:Tfp pilus assembly protein PilX